ncbi:MAG: HtrA2 peptidase [Parcubacteria group bacterium Gr01-1014_29]|nr:MAG: HtrA2 peptidase [Parcubacteria group bacterium Gr01-1014_29]
MFSWLGSIFAKITSATASILIAVSSVIAPSAPAPPPQAVAEVSMTTKSQTESGISTESVTSEIEKLKKEIEELKKVKPVSKAVVQVQTQQPAQPIAKKEPKTFTLPSGAVVDENGVILNQAELTQKQLLEELQRQRALFEQKKSNDIGSVEISNRIKPIVVLISTESGHGSGFIIEGDGLILTNAHVINRASSVSVRMYGGTTYTGTVVGFNEVVDLALIRINASGLPIVAFDDSGESSLPDTSTVYAFGFPFVPTTMTVEKGEITARRNLFGFEHLQTSAGIQKGNSGGPLANGSGRIIGVNTAGKFTKEGLGVGFNFAIPSNTVLNYLAQLKSGVQILDQNYSPGPPPPSSSSSSVPQPDRPQGSARTIPRSIVGSIEFNPNLTCDQLGVSDKATCWQYKLYKDRYNWTILDGQ